VRRETGGEHEVKVLYGEGFAHRTERPFTCTGLGAGPSSESLVRRKPRVGKGAVWLGAARPMGILGSRTKRWWGFGGRWLIVKGDPLDQAGQHFPR